MCFRLKSYNENKGISHGGLFAITRPRTSLNSRATSNSVLAPNLGSRGIYWSFLKTHELARGEEHWVMWLLFSAFFSSIYFFRIINISQHDFHFKDEVFLLKKYWTCVCYQKLTNLLVCFLPSILVQLGPLPYEKLWLWTQLCHVFWGHAVKAFNNFSPKLAWLFITIFSKFCLRDWSLHFFKVEIQTKLRQIHGNCESWRHFLMQYWHYLGPWMDETSVAYRYRKSISIMELFVSIISIYIGFLATNF